MKKIKLTPWACAALLLIGTLELSANLRAEPKAAKKSEGSAGDLSKINLDLPAGSTVRNLIDLLREKRPQLGYVLGPEAASVKLGEIALRFVNLQQLSGAVIVASGGRVDCVVNKVGDTISFIPNGAVEKKEVKAFNMGNSFTENNIAALKTMIQNAILCQEGENLPNGTQRSFPDLQYYPDASILVVVGERDAVQAAGQIIAALVAKSPADGAAQRPPPPAPAHP